MAFDTIFHSISHACKWVQDGELAQQTLLLGLTGAVAARLSTLAPTTVTGIHYTAIGTQLGTQMWLADKNIQMIEKKPELLCSRAFLKYRMLIISTGILKLCTYRNSQQRIDATTYLISASLATHLIQSFFILPKTVLYYNKLQNDDDNNDNVWLRRKFTICYSLNHMMVYACMAVNFYFFFSGGKLIHYY